MFDVILYNTVDWSTHVLYFGMIFFCYPALNYVHLDYCSPVLVHVMHISEHCTAICMRQTIWFNLFLAITDILFFSYMLPMMTYTTCYTTYNNCCNSTTELQWHTNCQNIISCNEFCSCRNKSYTQTHRDENKVSLTQPELC